MVLKKMIGGRRYNCTVINGAGQIFFGLEAEARFPLIKVIYSESGYIIGAGKELSRNLLTPGSIFKSTTNFTSMFGKATHTGLNILTGVERAKSSFLSSTEKGGNNAITSFTFLPIYFLPNDVGDKAKPKFITMTDNLKKIAEQQKKSVLPESNITVVAKSCSPTSLAYCNIGFETESADSKGSGLIVAKQKVVDLNGSRLGYSTNLENISLIGYDKIVFSPTIKDSTPSLENRITACKTYLKKYLNIPTEIKVSEYGLTQFACLYNERRYDATKEEETIEANKDVEFTGLDTDNEIRDEIKSLLNNNSSRSESTDATADVKDQILAYIIFFRLINTPGYAFNLSKRELFYICNYIAKKSQKPGESPNKEIITLTEDIIDQVKYGISDTNVSAPVQAPVQAPAPAPVQAPVPAPVPAENPQGNTGPSNKILSVKKYRMSLDGKDIVEKKNSNNRYSISDGYTLGD